MTEPVATIVAREPLAGETITIKKLPWWQVILVRVARTYFQTLAGLAAAFLVVPGAPSPMGGNVYVLGPVAAALLIAAQYALMPAVLALLQNIVELLGKLDQRAPEWRA